MWKYIKSDLGMYLIFSTVLIFIINDYINSKNNITTISENKDSAQPIPGQPGTG